VATPFLEFYWTLFDVHPFDPLTGAHPHYAVAPVPALTAWITQHTWRFYPALVESLVAGAGAILLFMAVGGNRACAPQESVCRNCGGILRNLSTPACPACPACGERI
jgi:hypothetical protein